MEKRAPCSIILPNYNDSDSLARALRAVLAQALAPERIIIVDDGSTDDSVKIISELVEPRSDVLFLRNPRNIGVERSIARALEASSTPYFCVASASDELSPDFLSAMQPWMQQHPDAGLYLADIAFRSHLRDEIYPKHLRLAPRAAYLSPERVVERLRSGGFILPAYACVFRREAWDRAGGLQPDLRWHADWLLELVLAFRHGLCYVPTVLAIADLSDTSYSAQARDWVAQGPVLRHLLGLLASPELEDVRPAFERSGALAYFGLQILRAALSGPAPAASLRALPYTDLLRVELRKQLLQRAPRAVRERLWSLRARLAPARPARAGFLSQAPRPHTSEEIREPARPL